MPEKVRPQDGKLYRSFEKPLFERGAVQHHRGVVVSPASDAAAISRCEARAGLGSRRLERQDGQCRPENCSGLSCQLCRIKSQDA
jgi:hypothetical protein